jgi:hypothetical protein
MPKPPKAVHTGEAKGRGQHFLGKLRLYEILFNLNQGFEQVLGQLQLLDKLGLGRPAVEFALCVMGRRTEPRSTSNWSSGSRSATCGIRRFGARSPFFMGATKSQPE